MPSLAQIIYLSFPSLLIIALIWCGDKILDGWKYLNKRGKRSPLKSYKLWRSPGESLREQIERQRWLAVFLLFSMPLSVFIYSPLYFAHLLALQKGTFRQSNFLFLVAMNLFLIGLAIYFMLRAWKESHKYLLGYEAEIYVGQQLNHLMAVGCRVFHDFQMEKLGNIDHIVVSPVGVFAVETKGRAKPDKKRGKKDATLLYDGKTLIFPESKKDGRPLEQAKRNAQALSKWLSSATGIPNVPVTPVVAMAGWFVDCRVKLPEVKVYNGKLLDDTGQLDPVRLKRSLFLLSPRNGGPLDDEKFCRIVHQLDAKCRDLEPVAYYKESGQGN